MRVDDLDKFISDHWEELQVGGQIPARTQIDPASLGPARKHHFILSKDGNTDFRIRVAGQLLNEMMQMDTRGMQLVSFFHPAARARALDVIEKVFSFPAYQRITLVTEPGIKSTIVGHMVFLPLMGVGGMVDRAIGGYCSEKADGISTGGQRFYVKSETTRLIKPPRRVQKPAHGFYQAAEPSASFEPSPLRKKSHLRLISSKNDSHHS